MNVSREQLKKYQRVISMWISKYDTWEIAKETGIPEPIIAAWVAHFRDLTRVAA